MSASSARICVHGRDVVDLERVDRAVLVLRENEEVQHPDHTGLREPGELLGDFTGEVLLPGRELDDEVVDGADLVQAGGCAVGHRAPPGGCGMLGHPCTMRASRRAASSPRMDEVPGATPRGPWNRRSSAPREVDMQVTVLVVVAAALFGWGLVSARLERADLTAPIVFIAVGAALARARAGRRPRRRRRRSSRWSRSPWSGCSSPTPPGSRCSELRRDVGRYVRLLAVGLPLTVLVGWGLAAWLFPALGVWLALLVGAALAPTDAALGRPGGDQPGRARPGSAG